MLSSNNSKAHVISEKEERKEGHYSPYRSCFTAALLSRFFSSHSFPEQFLIIKTEHAAHNLLIL